MSAVLPNSQVFSREVSRRTIVRGAGALGLATALGVRRQVFAAQEATPATPAVGDYPELAITAVEYKFDMPATAASGFTKVTFDNQGMMDHHAMFLRLNDGKTPDDLQAAIQSGDLGQVLAVATSLGGPQAGPGQQSAVIFDLKAGQYAVVCVIPDDDGIPHVAKGMLSNLEVTEGSSTATAPTADMTVELVDFGFADMAMDDTAGTHIWEVTNTAQQLHELVVNRIEPGFTFDQISSMLMAPPATPEANATAVSVPPSPMMEMSAPFVTIGGVAPMNPQQTNYPVLELEAGDYFAICYVPDVKTGAPHFALGMIMPFTVE